jgi:hypothetical protein
LKQISGDIDRYRKRKDSENGCGEEDHVTATRCQRIEEGAEKKAEIHSEATPTDGKGITGDMKTAVGDLMAMRGEDRIKKSRAPKSGSGGQRSQDDCGQ